MLSDAREMGYVKGVKHLLIGINDDGYTDTTPTFFPNGGPLYDFLAVMTILLVCV